MSKVKDCDFLKQNIDQLGIGIQASLVKCGADARTYMRDIVDVNSASYELRDSIMWRMTSKSSNKGAKASDTPSIEKPTDPYTVRTGSGAEHAPYVEKGSGVHLDKKGTELFISRLRDWAWLVLHIDGSVNGSPEDQRHFWNIVKHIRATGTEAKPFAEPTQAYMEKRAPQIIKNDLQQFIRQMRGKAK